MPLTVDELQPVDRVMDGAKLRHEFHALGHVPARAEEIHHVALGPDRTVALDHERRATLLFQPNGEGEPGDARARDQDGAVELHY